MPLPEQFGTLADEYHVASRNQGALKGVAKGYQLHYDPRIQQLMSEAPLHLKGRPRIALPALRSRVGMSVGEAITRRVSGHQFGSEPLSSLELASLLFLANGVREVQEANGQKIYQRNVPNSGNLGSVEIYPVVLNVTGIEPGIYHFDSVHHDLAQLRMGQFSTWLRQRVFFQIEFSEAAAALILTSAIGRLASKYGLRAYRLALFDVGHVSENLYLVSTGLGLEVCVTAGFVDDELDASLGLDGLECASLLIVLVGHRRVPPPSDAVKAGGSFAVATERNGDPSEGNPTED
jgi:SagB-type dehydrogenase family enzyme